MNIVTGVTLAVLGYIDIRKKRIPIIPVMVLGIAWFFVGEVKGEDPLTVLCGMIPGGLLMLFSYFSKEKIGMGDALLLLCLGAGYSWEQMVMLLFVALLLAALLSIILLLMKRAERKTELPFVPFVLAGWILVIYGGIV